MEVARPSSRVEIVAAMRTVRYEFRERGIRKTKVSLSVSTSGITVVRQKKKHPIWRHLSSNDETWKLLLQHPVHRIFYVSHDSQDLQIFSYIACDSSSVFRCHVFKAYRKKCAMQVVRTIGRAFDVCHQLMQQQHAAKASADEAKSTDGDDDDIHDNDVDTEDSQPDNELQQPAQNSAVTASDAVCSSAMDLPTSQPSSSRLLQLEAGTLLANTPVGVYRHQLRAVREKLRLEVARSDQYSAEARLARDQLKAEIDARNSIQKQAEQLLQQNQQLLEYITELLSYVGSPAKSVSFNRLASSLPRQISPASVLLSPSVVSNLAEMEHDISPDSGHRELSSDSLSASANTQSDASWHSAIAASTTYHHDLVTRLHSTMMSSPTYPVITPRSAASLQQSLLCHSSNLAQFCSLPQQLVSLPATTADISGRVLRNTTIHNSALHNSSSTSGSGLVLPTDIKTSLSFTDKSTSNVGDDRQLFVSENSLAEGQDSTSVMDDQTGLCIAGIEHE